MGDEAHIMFDNAEIREFIVLRNDEEPVSAAMAFVALQNDAELVLVQQIATSILTKDKCSLVLTVLRSVQTEMLKYS